MGEYIEPDQAINNAIGQIDNPLRHIVDEDELDQRGRDFAHDVDPISPDTALFEKAARIAYDPPNWFTAGIERHEEAAYRRGREASFWHQPRPLQATVIALCFSAIVQGWVQSVLNGSNVTLPIDFGLQDPVTRTWNGQQSLWIFAGLNAIVYLSAGLCGCWITDPLQSHYFGRRYTILAAACLCFASIIGSSFTTNWKQLMICRALLGCGLGAKASVTPVYCAEASPSHIRGALVINWQLYDAFGIFLGFSSGLALSSTGILSWRLQTASAAIPAFALIVLIWTVPESPRWLLKQKKYAAAFASMCALRHTHLEAAVELLFANEQVQREIELLPARSRSRALEDGPRHAGSRLQRGVAATTYWVRICQLFRNDRTRRATVAATVVMGCQQLCGINILCFYGTSFFSNINDKGSSSNTLNALWVSWGIGLANFIFAFPAYHWIDTRGRKFLLLVTYPGMILSMFGACMSFLREDEKVRFPLVCAFMFIFVAFYSFGQGPVAFAYASEVFPLYNREAGMSFSVFINLTGAGILTLLVPQAQVPPGVGGKAWQNVQVRLLGVFTALNVVSLILIFLFVPDTAGSTIPERRGTMYYLSLEEVNGIFVVKTWIRIKAEWRAIKRKFTQTFRPGRRPDSSFTYAVPLGNIDWTQRATAAENENMQSDTVHHENIAPHEIPEAVNPVSTTVSPREHQGLTQALTDALPGDDFRQRRTTRFEASQAITGHQIDGQNQGAPTHSEGIEDETDVYDIEDQRERQDLINDLSGIVERLRQMR